LRGVGAGLRTPDSAADRSTTAAALDYARTLHAGQSRSADGAPFILHPREVAALLRGAGAPEHLIAAGALHDVIEKTPALASDLRRRFGPKVATLVLAVTEDARIESWADRKAALCRQVQEAGEEALMLLAADKISKARELRIELGGRGRRRGDCETGSRRRRLAHYRRCLALLREHLPASPLVGQLGAELEGLSAVR